MIAIDSVPHGVFRRYEPTGDRAAVVLDVSRSGRRYPVDFLPDAPFSAVHSRISMYVDDLLSGAQETGATLLCAEFPITYVDPNRAIDDIDPGLIEEPWLSPLQPTDQSLKNGAGLIHSVGAGKAPLYRGKLSVAQVERRIKGYYEPYHAELARLLQLIRSHHGQVFHLSFHCMSSVDPKNPDGPQARRPDICLGDRSGTTCHASFREFVAERFTSLGYEVAINSPFKGSEIMRRYGAPASGVQSLQIELCKRLFMDERTAERSARFEQFRSEIRQIVRDVCSHAARQIAASAEQR